MTSSRPPLRRILPVLLLALGCSSGDDLVAGPDREAVPEATLEVLGQHAIRLRWQSAAGVRLRLERRTNLEGDFADLGGDLPQAQTSYIDGDLQPNTVYGYRLAGYDAFGARVGTSSVVAGRTSPPPGIDLVVTTTPTTKPEVDADGYELVVAGPSDTSRTPIDVTTQVLLSPLPVGSYHLAVAGVAPQCAPADSLARDAEITDEGTETLQHLSISILCRDPERGQLTVDLTTSGDLPDSNGFQVQVDGLADDTDLPQSERSYHRVQPVGMNGGSVLFDKVRPGTYQITVTDLAAHCTLQGPQEERFPIAVLDDLHKAFSISCIDPASASRPFTLRPTWVPPQAPTGTAVALDLILDLSATPGQDVAGYQTETRVAQDVLRFDSTTAGDLPNVFSNEALPGLILVQGFATGDKGPTGLVKLARVWFTVVGPDGAGATTQTAHSQTAGADLTRLIDTLIKVQEATFTVGSGGGGGNQAPHANANGPYSGEAGTPIAFSAAGSSDPDGSIASYAWTFGDGETETGAAPSHTYAAAGTYTATLTVTDDLGLTASATAQVTVTGGGGGGGGDDCGSGTADKPFVLCARWSPASAVAGDQVLLTETIDLSAVPTQDLVAFEITVLTDAALVRFDSARAGGIPNVVSNGATPGEARVQGFITGAGPTGSVEVAKIYYTVLGSAGTVTSQTSFANFVGTSLELLDSRISTDEGSLAIGGGLVTAP